MTPQEAKRLVGHSSPQPEAEPAKSYAGAAFNALMEEETKEGVVVMLLDQFDENRRLRARLEMTHAWQMVDGTMTRVEVEPGSIPDGIECRDETIRLQDREIDRLRCALRAVRASTCPRWQAQLIAEALREV